MRFGFALPQVGSLAGPEALLMVAKRAEGLGVDCLWVLDRLLWPVNPRAPYPLGDGSLPVQYKNVLDPVETLLFAAAHTSRIALATGVLNLPWYNPVLLARRLTTLDILSRGRLRVGFGIGWSPDEYESWLGESLKRQGRLGRIAASAPMSRSRCSRKSGRPIRWSFRASIIGFRNPLSVQSPCRNLIRRSIWRHLRVFCPETRRRRSRCLASGRYSTERGRSDVRRHQEHGKRGRSRSLRDRAYRHGGCRNS